MNMFGKLGEFIIEYQKEIELIFIIALVVAAIFIIGRIVRASRKKGEILSQISDTVTQINTTVTSINDKQNGVVYIDNRVGAETSPKDVKAAVSEALSDQKAVKECPPGAAGAAETGAGEAVLSGDADKPDSAAQPEILEAPETTSQPEPAGPEGDEPQAAGETTEAEKTEEPEAQAVRKYFSRNCAVSKTGRSYTIEELNDQIRE